MELGKNTDDSLESHLQKWELDPAFWESKFKKDLKITSPNVLMYVGKSGYKKLKKHVRGDWERNILKEMLGISVGDSAFEKRRKKDREQMIKRQEDNKRLFNSLRDLKTQGKDMVDEEVKIKVKQMRAALEIPENAWVQKNLEDLNSVIDNFNKLQLDATALEREELSEREVLLNASCSLALKGMIMNNKDKQTEDYNIVLAIPDFVKFVGPAISQTTETHSFTSKASKRDFTKNLLTFGYSVAVSAKAGSRVSLEVGSSISHSDEKEETQETHSSKTYYGQVKTAVVPVASYSFNMNELLLDESCIKALADLENICGLTNDEAMKQVECETFFHEYGSHINLGPIHFGGIYHWKSDYERDVRKNTDTVKTLNANALGAFVNLSYLGAAGVSADVSGASLKGSFEGDYEEEDLSSMKFQIETTGGPGEAGALPQWQCGLIANNLTWALIDRGLKFKGIWEMLSKHKERFDDAAKFEKLLITAWKKMTGLESDQYLIKKNDFLQAKDELDEMITLTNEYVQDDCFVENCKDYVVKICATKRSVLSKTKSNEFWRKHFRNKPDVFNFLRVVLQHKHDYPKKDIPYIKYNIGRILDGTEGLNFADKYALQQWIEKKEENKHLKSFDYSKATDIRTFILDVRNNILPKLEKSFPATNCETEHIVPTVKFTYIVKSFIALLNKRNDKYMVKFLTLMLLPLDYDVQAKIFRKYLSNKSLESFIKSLEICNESLRMFENQEVVQVEAYLLHLIIEQVDELLIQSDIKEDIKDVEREEKFQEILNIIEVNVETNYFSADTKTIIKMYGKPPISWKIFKRTINSRMDGVDCVPESLGSTLVEPLVIADNKSTLTQPTVTSCIKLDRKKEKVMDELKLKQFYPNELNPTDMRTFIWEVRNNILPKLEKYFSSSNDNINTGQMDVTVQLTHLVKSFLSFLSKRNDKYMVKFLTLMLLPLFFDVQAQVFQKYLTNKSLESFIKSLEIYGGRLRMYEKQGVMQVEAYLLHLITEQIDELLIQGDIKEEDKDVKREDKFLEILNIIEVNVETNYFSADTKTIIEKYGKPLISWKTFKRTLNSRMDGMDCVPEILGSTLAEPLVIADNKKTLAQPTVTDCIKLDIKKEKIMDHAFLVTEANKKTPIQPTETSCIKLNPDKGKEKIIDELGLKQFYPNKLTLTDIRKRSITDLKDLKDVPWIFLDKILMLDYRGRNKMRFPGEGITNNDKSDEIIKNLDESNESCDSEDDLARLIDEIKIQEENQAQENLNPMDVLVAVFLCSDDFLKKLLVKNLVMCRLSIPVVLPDINNKCIVQFWPLRGIILEELSKASTAVDRRIPIVSVIRLCKLQRSKSNLMNYILNNLSHATFFNKIDCNHGDEARVLSNGLVDATWHIPSSKDICNCKGKTKCKCFFKRMLMFLNLHGSCHEFQKQSKFVCQVSSLVLLFVDAHELRDSDVLSSFVELVSACKKCLLVITNNKKNNIPLSKLMTNSLEGLGQHRSKIKGVVLDYEKSKIKTLGKLKEDIISNVNNILGCNDVKSLQELHAEQVFELSTNEDNCNCKYGKKLAVSMIEIVNRSNLATAKTKFLPLQGDLWKKWGDLARKERKKSKLSGNETHEHYLSRLHEERIELRRNQLKIHNKPNKLIKYFIDNLLTLKADSRLYFVHWITHYLNELSRETLPSLRSQYFKKCSEIQEKKERKDNDANVHLKKLQEQLNDLQSDLEEASFGWEHLLREIGQIYEATKELESEIAPELKNNIEKLPRTMAELLISGYPIEIMDGNASHVPTLWIQAVFKQLEQLTGNKKVFVLSVLGIQSSGKSTLLNAMFGLQFSVSSGRCTQGVYAQFVPLPTNHKEKYGFDYIMVVDTEGLRAPELGGDNHNRDNELATLSIGMSDLTIINIKGENQTEMQDVLQIVIHAFLRMQMVNKNMKIKSSCFFTHQNVDAADAGNQMKIGQQKLLEKLNSMADAAATDLNIKYISSFSDIISFDINKDVFNFSNLWQGDPPMAPVNYGYSEKVSIVKRRILNEIIPNKKGQGEHNKGLSLSNLSNRLNDLWNGIMADDFVFSFKNSLEIKAFSALEETYSNLAYELGNAGSEWFNIVAMIKIQNTTDNHETVQIDLQNEFNIHITKRFSVVSDSLEQYFSASEDCGILEQWKASREKRLLENKHEVISRINFLIQAEIKLRKLHANIDVQLDEWTKQISDITTDLAKKLQGQHLSQKQLYSHFDKVWTEWLKKFQSKRESIQGQGINVYRSVYIVLCDVLKTENPLLQNNLKKIKLNNPVVNIRNSFKIQSEHIEKRKAAWYNLANIGVPTLQTCLSEATRLTNEIFDKIDKYLEGIAAQIFTKAHAQEILKIFTKFIDKSNDNPKRIFQFTTDYKVSVLIHTCRFGIPKFNEMHESYKKKADPSVREEKCRKQLLTQFISIYEKRTIEKTNADLISTYLETLIMEKVNEDIPRKIAEEVRKNNTFMHTTGALQAKILTKFANESRFENFCFYINNTKACLKEELKEYTNEYLFKTVNDEETTYFECAELKLDSKFNEVMKTIEKLTKLEEIKNDGEVHMKHWMNTFISEMERIIPVRSESLQLVNTEVKESNFSNFNSILVENLQTSLNSLKHFYKMCIVLPESFEKNINIRLTKEICSTQCPFCMVPCSRTGSDHDNEHSAAQHYPQGVGGVTTELTNILVLDTCTSMVATDHSFRCSATDMKWVEYKDYKTIYPKWNIQPELSFETSTFWKWFMATYSKDLESMYRANLTIPPAWSKFTSQDAKNSLITNHDKK